MSSVVILLLVVCVVARADRRAVGVRGTASPNTDNDKSAISSTAEMQPISASSSDETITVKIMNDTLSDSE